MNFSYGSHTVNLISVCVHFFSQKNKFQNECKYNAKDKKIQPAVSQLNERPFKLLKKKFCTKVGDKQLNDKYSDKIQWLF